MSETYDAVVVGARCAGATLAILLARAGRRVPAGRGPVPQRHDSTHVMFPDTLHRLDARRAAAAEGGARLPP